MRLTLPRTAARLSELGGRLDTAPARSVPGAASRGRLLLVAEHVGGGGAVPTLARYAPRLLAAGFEVTIVLLAEPSGEALEDRPPLNDIKVDAVPFRRLLDPVAGWRLLRHVRSLKPDLIHTQQPWAHVWGMLAARMQRVPALATLHPLHDLDHPRPSGRRRLADRILSRSAARIICGSDGLRQRYQAQARPAAGKLLTLHDGIEVDAYSVLPARHRDTLRENIGVPAGAPLAITVGALRPGKGVDLMLAALDALRWRWPDLHYLIVGDGEQRAALEQASVRLDLEERVGFAGWRTDVPLLLSCADLFVLPSREDGSPAVLAEAMAAGLPIVANAVGGVGELIEDGDNGLLVPVGDVEALAVACDRLIASPRLRRALGGRGRQIAAERFAVSVQVERLAGLYDQLIVAQRRQRRAQARRHA